MRLDELPIEYYHVEALQLIGNAIGKVLRIDTHTVCESKGKFARLCIQVDIGKPLVIALLIGGKEQAVCYKGVQRLCFACGRIRHWRENCPYVVRREATQARESDGDNDMKVDRECMAHALDSPGTKTSTSKNAGECVDTSCEDKLEDNPKDMYGPWVMVTRKRNGSKATKKGDHSEQHTLKKQEATIFGANELPLREGKRKAVANYSPNEAQMAKVVQSIAKGARGLGQNSGKAHNEAESPKEFLSPSVRGKKGIARNRTSLSSDNNLVVKPAGLESPLPTMASCLDNRGFNLNPSFNFKATSSGQSMGKGLEEGQMAVQTDMEVIPLMKVGEIMASWFALKLLW